MNSTDQTEAFFDSLNEVRDRLVFSYRELMDYEEKLRVLTKKTKSPPKENFMIRILSETITLNLYKFDEINNKSLTKILKELDSDFLKSTKVCLKPFKKNGTRNQEI